MRENRRTVLRVDRQSLSITASLDDPANKRYWHAESPQARIRHIEVLWQMNYGNLATQQLQRVLEVGEPAKN